MKKKQFIFFLVLVLLSGWIPALWFKWQATNLAWEQTGSTAWILHLLGLGPGIAALILLARQRRWLPREPAPAARAPLAVLAWLLFPCLGLAAAGLSVFLNWAEWDFGMQDVQAALTQQGFQPFTSLLLTPHAGLGVGLIALVLGPILWFLPAWVEELAWRGWLYRECRAWGFWPTALLAGGLWWLWTLPLFMLGYVYPGHPILGPIFGLGFGVTTSIILTWLREASGSVTIPAIARATLACSAFIALSITDLYDPTYAHLSGLCGLGMLLLAVLLVAWLRRDRALGGRPINHG